MSETFFLDPLEGEAICPEEPIFHDYIAQLPTGEVEFRCAPGRTDFSPSGPLVVGNCYDFEITYFPENWDMPPNTTVAFSIPRTWTQPQVAAPGGPGFVSAARSSGGPCAITVTHNENLQWWIKVEIQEAPEARDGFVRALYRSASVQRFPQSTYTNWRGVMQTVVDPEGKGRYEIVPAAATVKPVIKAAPPARFHVAAPAVAKPGQVILVKAAALDCFDNLADPAPIGDAFAASMDDPFTPIASTTLTSKDKGLACMDVPVLEGKNPFRVSVANRKDNLFGLSAQIVVDSRVETQNVYFGDIHAKTVHTDGLKTPTEYYEHARDVALTDFGAIADHNYWEASRVEGPFVKEMTDEAFCEIQAACEEFNQPGRFVTLQAFEQNDIKDYPGHRNVYFRGACPGLFRGETLEELYSYLSGHDALVIPHHTVIWHTRPHLDNTEYEPLIEMYSMHCSSEIKGSPLNNYRTSPHKAETGISAREVLDEGFRVGFIAASDNHNGAPGLSARPSRFTNLTYRGGLAAVIAPELTREAIFDALRNRRCYATNGHRIYLDFRLNGRAMGSEICIDGPATLPYEITVAGTERIARIELIMNGEERLLWTYDGRDYVHVQEECRFERPSSWLYVRVIQIDRGMAWSSPVWVDVKTA